MSSMSNSNADSDVCAGLECSGPDAARRSLLAASISLAAVPGRGACDTLPFKLGWFLPVHMELP